MTPATPSSHRSVLDILTSTGIIEEEDVKAIQDYVASTGERVEEAIVDLAILDEADLLKHLAAYHKTRFVTTDGLQKAVVPRATLEMIPRRVAETFGVCPVMFDPKQNVLSVVTADPSRPDVMRELQLVSGARSVLAFVARPAAVRACISRGYAGDPRAFAIFDRQAAHGMLEVFPRGGSGGSKGGSVARAKAPVPDIAAPRIAPQRAPRDLGEMPAPPPMPAGGHGGHGGRQGSQSAQSGQSVQRAPLHLTPPPPPPEPTLSRSGPATPSGRTARREMARESTLEILSVMVSLIENTRQDLRGHSALVARLCKRLAERVGLDATVSQSSAIAAQIHDLGKMGRYHLTALNVAEYDGHRTAAQKAVLSPARLFESAELPDDAMAAVNSMYERYDGKGFPGGSSGKEIPVLARILAITDTYADLTHNARNPYRKTLSPQETFGILANYKETVFDPHLVDLFKSLMLGEDLRARLLDARYTALLIDADPEDTTVLELRLLEAGIDVKVARSSVEAVKLLEKGDIDIVLSELDLPGGDGTDGLSLLADARSKPWGKTLPWMVYTRRTSHADAQRAFELGVLDFASKLSQESLLVAKVRALLDGRGGNRSSRGVTGSIREMSLPDIVQVLTSGRKSGSLRIRAGAESGEIHLADGDVVDAEWGKIRGEEAFYAMLKLSDGDFALDPAFVPQGRVIQLSSEMLLLEGMRRLDEG